MNLLLDTHVFLWWLQDSYRLGDDARADISNELNAIWISAASIWEMAIKLSLGKLAMETKDAERLAELIEENGFQELPISAQHAARVRALPSLHGDPFDRILIAQAQQEGLSIVTADPTIAAYPVSTRCVT